MKFSLIIPAHNEEVCLAENIGQTLLFLQKNFPDQDWEVVIVENGSNDATKKIAEKLAQENTNLQVMAIPTAGKGLAVRTAWNASTAERLIFMDADLATELKHLPELINALDDNELTFGTRRHRASRVERSRQRTIISVLYIWLARLILNLPFSDLQCGFKGIRNEAWKKISPFCSSVGFFFDTELLAMVNKHQFKTGELPIVWKDKRDKKNKSKVKIFKTGKNLLKNLLALKKRLDVIK